MSFTLFFFTAASLQPNPLQHRPYSALLPIPPLYHAPFIPSIPCSSLLHLHLSLLSSFPHIHPTPSPLASLILLLSHYPPPPPPPATLSLTFPPSPLVLFFLWSGICVGVACLLSPRYSGGQWLMMGPSLGACWTTSGATGTIK